MKIPKELLEASEYVFLQKNGLELTLFSGLLVKIPKELLHAGGAAGKVGTAETALLQLGPAIITDKVPVDTLVDSLGWVEAVPADNALWCWESA